MFKVICIDASYKPPHQEIPSIVKDGGVYHVKNLHTVWGEDYYEFYEQLEVGYRVEAFVRIGDDDEEEIQQKRKERELDAIINEHYFHDLK